MISKGTLVLLLFAAFMAYRGRPVITGLILCVALATTAAGTTGIAEAKQLSTNVGTTASQIMNSVVK